MDGKGCGRRHLSIRIFRRIEFLNRRDPCHGGTSMQPLRELFDFRYCPMHDHLDRSIGQIAGHAAQPELLRLEARVVAEGDALHPTQDEEPAGNDVHGEGLQIARWQLRR